MKLRSQISLFLLLLGLTPLVISAIINVPLVFEKLEQFYHKAYLEKLRTDFRDLDQHITRRQEMVRLFAKLPEPGIALGRNGELSAEELADARDSYVDWSNRVLYDQLDIIQVIFIDSDGRISLALNRSQQSGLLEADLEAADPPHPKFLADGLQIEPGAVLTGPISLDRSANDQAPNRFMTLSFISPLVASSAEDGAPELRGVVVFNLDVGGLAHVYNGIHWVQDDGHYLSDGYTASSTGASAFTDFPGLEELFARGEFGLWERGGQQVFWLPLFAVQDAGPLWVGRSVDPSPLVQFVRKLELRVVLIIGLLLLVTWLVARKFAIRAERISDELLQKMSTVLEKDQAVTFSWSRPEELRVLGDTLSRLSEKHASDVRALREHARALEDSNRYKSEFLANVSHELRTPLNSILLLSKMLAGNDSLAEQSRQQAQVIHSAGADLRTLIDTILDLSRIEAGKSAVNAGPIDLPGLLKDLADLMRPQFEAEGLQLELVVDNDAPPALTSDAEKLRQILINFLSNALKFTERGSTVMRLARNRSADARALPVCISVDDTGIGIPSDMQAQVFEAFSQVDGSTSRRYGGTGLGLTISRQLAQLLGGRISVDSTVGRGSTFTLLLPEHCDHRRYEPATPAAASGHTDAPAGDPGLYSLPAASYSGCRVLLVDDDIRNLLALTPVLEHWDIEVVAAGDGVEALETLGEDPHFDLIFMDLMMPSLDGFETITRIRQNPALVAIPIIALTAKTADSDRRHALECGAADFLAKPVEPADLKLALDQYLCKHPQQEPS